MPSLFTILWLTSFIATLTWMSWPKVKARQGKSLGIITLTKGDVQTRPSGEHAWYGVEKNFPVYSFDLISTGNQSKATITLTDGTNILLPEKSQIKLLPAPLDRGIELAVLDGAIKVSQQTFVDQKRGSEKNQKNRPLPKANLTVRTNNYRFDLSQLGGAATIDQKNSISTDTPNSIKVESSQTSALLVPKQHLENRAAQEDYRTKGPGEDPKSKTTQNLSAISSGVGIGLGSIKKTVKYQFANDTSSLDNSRVTVSIPNESAPTKNNSGSRDDKIPENKTELTTKFQESSNQLFETALALSILQKRPQGDEAKKEVSNSASPKDNMVSELQTLLQRKIEVESNSTKSSDIETKNTPPEKNETELSKVKPVNKKQPIDKTTQKKPAEQKIDPKPVSGIPSLSPAERQIWSAKPLALSGDGTLLFPLANQSVPSQEDWTTVVRVHQSSTGTIQTIPATMQGDQLAINYKQILGFLESGQQSVRLSFTAGLRHKVTKTTSFSSGIATVTLRSIIIQSPTMIRYSDLRPNPANSEHYPWFNPIASATKTIYVYQPEVMTTLAPLLINNLGTLWPMSHPYGGYQAYGVKNGKVMVSVPTQEQDTLIQQFSSLGLDLIFVGMQTSFLGGRQNGGLQSFLDKSNSIYYVRHGKTLKLDKELLNSHASARDFISQFKPYFFKESVNILKSKD